MWLPGPDLPYLSAGACLVALDDAGTEFLLAGGTYGNDENTARSWRCSGTCDQWTEVKPGRQR